MLRTVDMLDLRLIDGGNSALDGEELLGDYVDDSVSLREVVLLKLKCGSNPVA